MERNRRERVTHTLPFLEMTERMLQYLWQFQYFEKTDLRTISGETLEIINTGVLNKHQGPDFLNAQIRVDQTILAGSVELHLQTSHWKLHGHDDDPNYRNVILHVVYKHDCIPSSYFPVLELEPRISRIMLQRYNSLLNQTAFIPCAGAAHKVQELIWESWKERMIAERLERKAMPLMEWLGKNHFAWEEAFWHLLARHFGGPVNGETFEAVARSLPLRLILKHRYQIQQLEALLFGQAGLLEQEFKESYPALLQREYKFLQKKFNLRPVSFPVHFLRMRPGNFPTVRLAQLAMLLHSHTNMFANVSLVENADALSQFFSVTANDYWHYHFRFEEEGGYHPKVLGAEVTNRIVINVVIPMLYCYGRHHGDERYIHRIMKWLNELDPENNAITRGFHAQGLQSKSALDSQAFLELKSFYCEQKKCLGCAVGNAILKEGFT